MRLLMYRDDAGPHLGALVGDRVIDLPAVAAQTGHGPLPNDLLSLIDAGEDALNRVRHMLDAAEHGQGQPVAAVMLLPPLPAPRGNVLCIGRNYAEHAKESARATGEKIDRPTVFTKAFTSINGPYNDIPLHSQLTRQVDWEAELGVVIGRTGINIPRDRALDYVFGYTVINDVSARDVQYGWGGQFFKGKSLDGFCPIGPWVVTRDEIPDPQQLRVRLRVNGETKQDASTADMIFPVDEIIAQLSQGMSIPAGSLIATGTPEGVNFGKDPNAYLHDGDVMETEVDAIGVMRNRMVDH